MKQVTIQEAKTHLSELIQQALNGEEIIIAKEKEPLVKLVVVTEIRKPRRLGGSPDLVKYMAEDFDDPLDMSSAR